MAQFRAQIIGNRGVASRLGSKDSGLRAQMDGWTGGVTVRANHWPKGSRAAEAIAGGNAVDVFDIYATKGSGFGDGFGYIGKVHGSGEFWPSDALRQQIIEEYEATKLTAITTGEF